MKYRAWKRSRRKRRLRLLAMTLAFCLLFTTYPDILETLPVFAAGTQSGGGTVDVAGFAGLTEEETGAPPESAEEETGAQPESAEEETQAPPEGTGEETGSPETERTETEESADDTQPEQEANGENAADNAAGSGESAPSVQTDQTEDAKPTQETHTVTMPEYQADSVIQALLERIAALPDAEEYLAGEPEAEAGEEAYAEWMAGLYQYAGEALDIQEAYEALTEEQKAQIPEEAFTKLAAWAELAETAGERAQVLAETTMSGTCGAAGNEDNVIWAYDGAGKLTISGSGAMADYLLKNFESDTPWYSHRNSITTVEIQSGVTNIGNFAFYRFDNLTSVSIPNSVITIGDDAFASCHNLASVNIPSSVTTIGTSAFQQSGLTSIIIPNGVTTMGSCAFIYCSDLKSVTIPESLTVLQGHAFKGCPALTDIIMPNTLKTIEEYVFADCIKLTEITIPDRVTSIGYKAFDGCTSLTSITIPSGVTEIHTSTFEGCTGLTSVTMPNVTTIGISAFSSCTGLTTVSMDKVTSIGSSAFKDCKSLNSISMPKVTTIGTNAFSSCIGLQNISLPNSVTTIDVNAFYKCTGLKSVTIPEHITKVPDSMFYGCTSLETVTMPGVTLIGNSAFYGCTSLKSEEFRIPTGVTIISANAFASCTGLTSITIPSGVTKINTSAFEGCTALKTVQFLNGQPPVLGASDVFKDCGFMNDDDPETGIMVPRTYVPIYENAWGTNLPNFEKNITNHYHRLCGTTGSTTCSHKGGSHTGKVEYIPFPEPGENGVITLTAGKSYYLTESVTLAGTSSQVRISGADGSDDTVNICLNGYTITGGSSAAFSIHDSANVNICDCNSSKNGNGKIINNSNSQIIYVDNSELNIYGGIIETTDSTVMGINLGKNSTLNLYGGKISTIGTAINVATNATDANINIYEGATVKSTSGYAIHTQSSSTIKINGGTIHSDSNAAIYAIYYKYSNSDANTPTLIISDGNIKGGSGIYIDSGTVEITGGTIESTNGGSATIDNTVNGTLKITGGKVISKHIAIANSGTVTIENTAEEGISSSGGWALFNYAGASATISGGKLENTYYSGSAIGNEGTVNVRGGAEITSTSASGTAINNGVNNKAATLTIEGGTITSDFYALKNNTDATATISGGVFTTSKDTCIFNNGKMEITGANSINAKSYPVGNNGELTISGGTYKSNNGNISNSGTLKLSGNPTFTNTGIRLTSKDAMINIAGALTYTNPCRVNIYEHSNNGNTVPRTFTTGWNTYMSDKQLSDYFKSNLEYCTVVLKDNEGYIRPSKVTFDLNYTGCTNGEPVSVATNCKVSFPTAPTREGYVFGGWYDAKTGGTMFTADSTFTTGDTTLYARWEQCTHTFDSYTTTDTTHTGVCTVCGLTVTENHEFKYSVSYQNMYEKCDKDCGHRAIATLTIPNDADLTYTGSAITPATITYGGDKWVGEKKPTVEYYNNTNAGTAGAKLWYNTIETTSTEFVIKPKSLTADMVTLGSASYPHTGSAVKPDVTVKDGDKTLTENTDYTVQYENNINVGNSAKVTITGNGNYTGSASKTFSITADKGWTLAEDGTLTIRTQAGMDDWTTNKTTYASKRSQVTNVTIADGVTSIGGHAFNGCSGLTSVTIPDKVTSIEDYAFKGCSGLTSVTIPDSVTSIGQHAFYGCSSLTSVTIPDKVTSIEDYAFEGCSGLTSVTIPDSVTSIGGHAFNGCSSLTSIEIPASVNSIGGMAFYVCRNLAKVTMDSENPPALGISAFNGCSFVKEKTKGIYVPVGKEEAYKGASNWSTYADYITDGLPEITKQPENKTVRNGGQAEFSVTAEGEAPLRYQWQVSKMGETSFTNIQDATSSTYTIPAVGKDCDGNQYRCVVTNDRGTTAGKPATSDPATLTVAYGVTYDYGTNGGTSAQVTSSDPIAKGTAIDLTPTAAKTGWDFVGWNTDKKATTGLGSLTMGDSDVTLYAIYSKTLNASFYSGNKGQEPQTVSVTIYNNEESGSITLPSLKEWAGDSHTYTADGWKHSDSLLTAGGSFTLTEDEAFYGGYKQTVTLSFDANGGEGSESEITGYRYATVKESEIDYADDEVKLPDGNNLSREGYTFSGWKQGSTEGAEAAGGASVTVPKEDTTYYAAWKMSDYKVTLNGNGGSGDTALDSYTYGTGATLPVDWTKTGYIFDGWYKNSDFSGDKVTAISVTDTGDKTFYAKWTASTYTVTFDYQSETGGNTTQTKTVTYGSVYGELPAPEREGYTFAGWYTKADNTGSKVTKDTVVDTAENHTLYAHWVLVPMQVTDGDWSGVVTSDDSVKIVDYSGSDTAVEVPSVIDGKTVTAIGENAFANHTEITSVTIPGSVTEIGEGAFSGCTGLTSVTIPDSVTTIGENAFAGCTGLTSVTIPDSVTTIGENAFSGCTGLTSVTIPDSVTTIGENAFAGCTGLTSVTIPDSVTEIGDGAFSGCTGLTSVTIPDSVTTIGEGAFSGCTGLTTITIPDSVTTIGENAFAGCTGLTSVIIPEGVDTEKAGITDTAAKVTYTVNEENGTITITSVTPGSDTAVEVPSEIDGKTVTAIGENAFADNTEITSVTIPDSVTTIGEGAFSGCTGLTSVIIPEGVDTEKAGITDTAAKVTYTVEENGTITITSVTPGSDTAVEVPSVIDGKTVTAIGENAFADNTEITSVTIPGSVTEIGEGAFSGCTGLTTITIPDSVTTIGENAFSGCTGLTSVTIPDSVTEIGDGAFSGCTGLTSVIIPEGVDTSQAGITDTAAKVTYTVNEENGEITITSVTPGSDTAVEVPSEIDGKPVTAIGKDAFADNTEITSVTIPGSVTEIGEGAFSGCTGLTTVIIPDSVDTEKAGITDTAAKITYTVDENGTITITSVTPGTDRDGGKKPVTLPDTIGGKEPEISDAVKEEMKEIPHEHTLTKTEGVEPTCTSDGNMAYWTCSKCGKMFSDENGTTEVTAKEVKKAALGHDWSGEWVVKEQPTPTKDGIEETACKHGCGKTQQRAISATGDPYAGNLETDADVEKGAPIEGAKLGNKEAELLDGILSADEKAEVKGGRNVKIWLEISKTVENEISDTDKTSVLKAAKQVLGDDVKLVYFDMDLFKQLDGGEKIKITEPGMKIKVIVKIPDTLLNHDKNILREYKVIRLHNGEVTVISGDFDAGTRELSFETDKFSTYVIAYSDTQLAADDNNENTDDSQTTEQPDTQDTNTDPANTGDDSNPVFWILLMLMSMTVLAGLFAKKRKFHSENE